MIEPNFLAVPKGTLYRNLDEKDSLESRNGAIQAMFVFETITRWQQGDRITPNLLLEFQRLAVNQIYRCAGNFRDGPVVIRNSAEEIVHAPPDACLVSNLVDEMCEYINENWGTRKPIHLSAYAMWRLNWIHPFFGGNGRTARAFSYLVLCIGLQLVLPANLKTIPQLIEENRDPYIQALRAADAAWAEGRCDDSGMENVLSDLLAMQLVFLHQEATGVNHLDEPT